MMGNLARKAIEAEIESTFDAYSDDRRDELVPLIRAIQRAATPREVMAVQLHLRDMFAGRQHTLDEIRSLLVADKASRDRLAPLKPQPRDEVERLNQEIARGERMLLRDDVIQHVVRCLADALVWKATLFDRALFSVLGDGDRVGRFPDEAGAKPERKRGQEIWDAGAVPFFNDMTNCLRHGDLTILHSRWPDADVAVDEVKRSGRHRTGTPQALRLDRKLELLNRGRADGGDAKELGLRRLPLTYGHHLGELASVLARARKTGYAEAQPHPALVVSAVDLRWAVQHQDESGDWMARAARARGWDPGDERHFGESHLVRRLRERRHAGAAYHAPIGIFPLCAEDIADLLMGRFDYAAVLRVDALELAFAQRSIAVGFATGREAHDVFLHARRGADEIIVPAHLRNQMLRELMSVETLVDTVDLLLDDPGASAVGDFLVVCDERTSWGRAPAYPAA